jgi:hypothetical protein
MEMHLCCQSLWQLLLPRYENSGSYVKIPGIVQQIVAPAILPSFEKRQQGQGLFYNYPHTNLPGNRENIIKSKKIPAL